MALNPQFLEWQAPTHEVDGSLINYPLVYILGVSSMPNDPAMNEVASFPGVLNPGGNYQQDTSELAAFDGDGTYYIRLKAARADQQAYQSVWSNEVAHTFDRPANPTAPFLLG